MAFGEGVRARRDLSGAALRDAGFAEAGGLTPFAGFAVDLVLLAAGVDVLSAAAPKTVPSMPPRTAPTGPATIAPTTAPEVPMAVFLPMGNASISPLFRATESFREDGRI